MKIPEHSFIILVHRSDDARHIGIKIEPDRIFGYNIFNHIAVGSTNHARVRKI
ncbi:MAG: hypothetical protein P1V20_22995 [Verrucomicrobiales bacterium]|nr:hypothetical protein [Verrucomicrobiales bacterium]